MIEAIGRLLCRVGIHRWALYLPSWGRFRNCRRCDRVEQYLSTRGVWREVTRYMMEDPNGY